MLISLKYHSRSFEFFARDVVHRQVVHVSLDELKSLLFDHASRLTLEHAAELLNQVSADTLALFCLVEGMSDDFLNIIQSLNALTHTEGEVAEPLVIQGDGPVFAKEFDSIGNDVVLIALGQLVKVVFVKTNETPQTL